MKNLQVIEAFVERSNNKAKATNLYIAGNKLVNYQTIIAQHVDGKVLFNKTKYSMSTTTIQNQVKRLLQEHSYNIEELENVPMNCQDLSIV